MKKYENVMSENKRLSDLFKRYHKGITSPEERDELMHLLKDVPDEELAVLLSETWNAQDAEQTFFSPATGEKMLAKILPAQDEETVVHHMERPVRNLFSRVAAAAVIILVLSVSAIFVFKKTTSNGVGETAHKKPVVTDIAPGGDKAILTLADGSKIILDSAANGNITQQGGTKVIKTGGELAYSAEEKTTEVLYNTIATPTGGQYRLLLADGSKVWLNAVSSIRFPTAFTGSERKVEISGEAYFEIAHDASKPFTVSVNGTEVQVLGTHFNINAYTDEELMRTTLLEGKIKIKKGDKSELLNPGQQAVTDNKTAAIKIISDADVDDAVAWKDGLFNFEHSDLNQILREFARWYGVQVEMEENMSGKTFFGIVSRNSSLASVLKALKNGGPNDINYKLEGKRLIVQHASKN
ncbi:MAG: hypothetical protein JWN76_2370 [Chitinophagaceae bacterium]|nr:hypothetical protein [Chitinophagaceae bacterium]